MFTHYDRRGKCEWFGGGLEEFVIHYNRKNGTNYVRTECLDVVKIGGSTTKRPEVLVTDSSDRTRMVIERKSVVWPPDYILRHNVEHAFAEAIWAETAGWYNDASYELVVSSKQMEALDTRKVQEIAREIGSSIARLGESTLPVARNHPVSWTFAARAHGDRKGIVIIHEAVARLEDFIDDSARIGTAAEIQRQLNAASLKFTEYSKEKCIVLLDFYGTDLWEDDIPPLIGKTDVPDNIDEVWMSRRDWISEDDFEIGYERIFSRTVDAV